MAQTLLVRKMRSVGTLNGGPPIVKTYPSAEALAIGDVVVIVPGTGKAAKADGTILVTAGTDDRIDISDLTDAGEGFLAGLVITTATAADVNTKVALFHKDQVFEATLQNGTDGTTQTTIAALQAHHGDPVAIVLNDDGTYVVSLTEGTETAGHVVEVGYGFNGENTTSGHGVIGDSNARCRFVVVDNLTLLGQ